MIPDQWYVILESNEVKPGKPIGFTRFGEPLVAWRDTRGIVAFVPIGDANTLMYLRSYQRIVKAPILRQAFNFLGAAGNLVIERQDKRVVIKQEPRRADLDIGEKLIPGDGPIIQCRRQRRDLIEKAAAAT